MPEERIADKIKIVNLVSVIYWLPFLFFVHKLMLYFYYVRFDNFSLEVDSIAQIDFTEIQEVVLSFKIFYGLSHRLNVQIIFDEKIFVGPLFAPVPGVELLLDGFAC